MIRVRVGISDYVLNDVREDWLNREINGRRHDGVPVCVQVTLRADDIDMVLSTSACGSSGGGRSATPQDSAILKIWNQQHLNENGFTGENVIAFLKQVQSLI